MIKKIAIGLLVIVLAFVAFIATRPPEFRIERSATILALPATVFSQVDDFQLWQEWSPWAKIDPAAKATFEGPASGVGAVFKWDGNDQVGAGIMTITESRPNEFIRIRLEFLRPFLVTNTAEFTFRAEGNQTVVTWAMFGHNNFVQRAVCLVMNMDDIVGGQFAQGLASMKAIVEKTAAQ